MFGVALSVTASAYGNAARAQKTFEEHIAAQLADDIADAGAKSADAAVAP
jgi:hypothetical protein